MLRTAANWTILLAAAALVFALFFHPQILDPTNIGWTLKGDLGAHVTGWHAFRNDAWRWPPTATALIGWPTGTVIGFTDSNPLVAMALKPFGALLPDRFQFIGAWFLACLVLQAAIGYRLLRSLAPDGAPAAGAAAVLLLFPPMLHRIWHDTLFAQWIILWALWVFFAVRGQTRRDWWFRAVLLVALLVHPYLFVMAAAIWCGDVLRAYAAIEPGDRRALIRLGMSAAGTLALALAAILATGLAPGEALNASGFGYYSMNLNAPINPIEQDRSAFLPTRPVGPGQYEGFQYLGAGCLLLVAVAAVVAGLRPGTRRALGRTTTGMRWLLLPLLGLTLLALSNVVMLDDHLLVRLPSFGDLSHKYLQVVRASGRLFLPVAYLALVLALAAVLTLPRPVAAAVLALVIGVQVADLRPFAATSRQITIEAEGGVDFHRAGSAAWDELVAAARLVEFEPSDWDHIAGRRTYFEIAWRAISAGTPVNAVHAARLSARQDGILRDMRRSFEAGVIDPERLYVILDPGIVPEGARDLVRRLDGVLVIPPASQASNPALAPAGE